MKKPTTKEMLKELEGYRGMNDMLVIGKEPHNKEWEVEQFIRLTDGIIRVKGFGKTKRAAIEQCLRMVRENLT